MRRAPSTPSGRRPPVAVAPQPDDIVAVIRQLSRPAWRRPDGATRIRRATAAPDPTGDRVIRRVIHKKKTIKSEAYDRIRLAPIYQEAQWTPAQKDLIVAMSDSDVDFTIADVRKYLAWTPLPTIADVEREHQGLARANAKAKAKAKRNEQAKARQKRKSTLVKGKGAGLAVNFKRPVGGTTKRTILKRDIDRGAAAIGLGRKALRNVLASGTPNAMKLVDGPRQCDAGRHEAGAIRASSAAPR